MASGSPPSMDANESQPVPRSRFNASQFPIYPLTPMDPDPNAFVITFMRIHRSSANSYRYAYYLWWAIFIVFVGFVLSHQLHIRASWLGAWFSRWSLRRRTWRKQAHERFKKRNPKTHRQPTIMASNAQLLTISFLTGAVILACFAGPDYISPNASFSQFWPRDPPPSPSEISQFAPRYTIAKAWWTVGNRTGIITFALLPLVVLFALKAPPTALLSMPWTLNLHFDKLVRLHRWTGLLAWVVCTIHAGAWTIQVSTETRSGDRQTGRSLWYYAFLYPNFRYALTSYICMTVLMIMSLPFVRKRYYEQFFFAHIILVPLFIIFAALHFPGIAYWCWIALGLWGADRAIRLGRFLYVNGYILRSINLGVARVPDYKASHDWDKDKPWLSRKPSTRNRESFIAYMEHHPLGLSDIPRIRDPQSIPTGFAKAELLPGRTMRIQVMTHRGFRWAPGQHAHLRVPSISMWTTHPFTIASVCQADTFGSDGTFDAVTFIIRAKSGFTKRLWNEISRLMLMYPGAPFNPEVSGPSPPVLLRAQIDGPMGSVSRVRWDEFSTVVIICGGSGVSFGVAILQHLCFSLAAMKKGGGIPYKVDRIRFIWLIREYAHMQWAALEIYECLKMLSKSYTSATIRIDIHVSNPVKRQDSTASLANILPSAHNSSTSLPRSRTPTPAPTMSLSPTDLIGRQIRMDTLEATLELPGRSLAGTRPTTPIQMERDSDDESTLMNLRYRRTQSSIDIYTHTDNTTDEFDPMDLTNFDGDDDTQGPGEAALSYNIKKEGDFRRRAMKGRVPSIAARGGQWQGREYPSLRAMPSVPENIALESAVPGSAILRSAVPEDTAPENAAPENAAPENTTLEDAVPESDSPLPMASMDPESSSTTLAKPRSKTLGEDLESATQPFDSGDSLPAPIPIYPLDRRSSLPRSRSYPPGQSNIPVGKGLQKQLGDEAQAMSVLSMYAMPGRPPLDDILAMEINRSKGRIAVATCGPASLDVLVRKTVAAKIQPGMLRNGDLRGSVTLISEEFDY